MINLGLVADPLRYRALPGFLRLLSEGLSLQLGDLLLASWSNG